MIVVVSLKGIDFVNSLTSELLYIDRRMSVLLVFFPVGSSGATVGICLISYDCQVLHLNSHILKNVNTFCQSHVIHISP